MDEFDRIVAAIAEGEVAAEAVEKYVLLQGGPDAVIKLKATVAMRIPTAERSDLDNSFILVAQAKELL